MYPPPSSPPTPTTTRPPTHLLPRARGTDARSSGDSRPFLQEVVPSRVLVDLISHVILGAGVGRFELHHRVERLGLAALAKAVRDLC